ncbi:carboxypeptidase regulatory-like domain-containing protein [Actinoplanes sp. NPDC051859]|uniref:carboxypeptidase-like regulatory domain-containing protein n=1 Tax=Actinoplanes sp. NPDC051859 TaxID=3363909 RepID=UPI0037B790CC
MTTHLRALQAGAFLAMLGGVLVAAPSAALAAVEPSVSITSLSSGDIPSGGKTTLTYTVANKNVDVPGADAGVSVVIEAGGMACSGQCNLSDTIPAGSNKTFTATLTAGSVDAGQTKNITVRIVATIDGASGSADRSVIVRGPDKPQTVRQVSGKVKDQDGKSVAGAQVGLRDSQGHTYSTASNSDGGYSFTSSDSAPISTGQLTVGAAMQGYDTVAVNAEGGAGRSVNVPLTIKSKATPTSATPSAQASATPAASAETADDATLADAGAETPAATSDQKKAASEDDSSGSMLFIIMGGLLVAGGIGAIVLMLMRRKSNPDESDDSDSGLAKSPLAPAPSRYSGADQTRMAPAVGVRGGDATIIAPRSGAPSMSDAPTMIHRGPAAAEPVDEFPDPYGAPLPQNGAYNAPGGWGATPAAGAAGAAGAAYGTATQFGGAPVPAQSGGYDDRDAHGYSGGYDDRTAYDNNQAGYDQTGYDQGRDQQRFDEPTGMYRPTPDAYGPEQGYDGGYGAGEYASQDQQAGGAYQAGGYQGGSYGQQSADQGGYGGWDGPGAGIDSGNAYGPQAGGNYGAPQQGGGTYGAPQQAGTYGNAGQSGYADQGGYDQGGYDQPGGGTYGGGSYGGYNDGGQQGGNAYSGAPQAGGTYGGAAPAGTYGGPAQGGGTYGGNPAQGGTYGAGQGYADQGGYDQGGYDQRGGSYSGGPYGGTGYDGDQGRRGAPRPQAPEGSHPGQRRQGDWNDG